jgi:hypothetical protein
VLNEEKQRNQLHAVHNKQLFNNISIVGAFMKFPHGNELADTVSGVSPTSNAESARCFSTLKSNYDIFEKFDGSEKTESTGRRLATQGIYLRDTELVRRLPWKQKGRVSLQIKIFTSVISS